MTEPADISPENRDWTFVITEGCKECGFNPQQPETTGGRLLATIATWQQALAAPTASERLSPTVWSPLEYGCHVRDVCQLFRQRLELMLSEDDPAFANWDQDATAVEKDYFHQDPAEVSLALVTQATATAAAFDSVAGNQWDRSGRRSNGSVFSVATFAVYFLHDIEHHLHDIAPA
jgi:DinB superfamily